jgi:uncharacterized protein YjbI with pentapeptide repeats
LISKLDRRLAACLVLAASLAATAVQADQRQDFLAGRTHDCPRCDLAGVNFKRRDLSGADLTGANLARNSPAPTSLAQISTKLI